VPGRRRGTAAYRRPQGGGEGLRNCRAHGPDVGTRRDQGGGEIPPLIEGPREEERGSELSGTWPFCLCGGDLGRRREVAAGLDALREEEESASRKL